MVKYLKTKRHLKYGEKKRNKKTKSKTRKTKTRKTKTMIGGEGGEKSIEQSQLEEQLKQAGKYDEWVSKGSKFGRPTKAGDSFSRSGTYLDMNGNKVNIELATSQFNKFKDNQGYIPVFLQPEDKPEPQPQSASWWNRMFPKSPPKPLMVHGPKLEYKHFGGVEEDGIYPSDQKMIDQNYQEMIDHHQKIIDNYQEMIEKSKL